MMSSSLLRISDTSALREVTRLAPGRAERGVGVAPESLPREALRAWSSASPIRALVVSLGEARHRPEGNQVKGFSMYRRELAEQLGVEPEVVAAKGLNEVERAVASHPCDVAFIMVAWHEKPDEVVAAFERMASRPGRPRLVFVDYFAPASSPFFGVLPYVDCYLKRQAYRDPRMYARDFRGGNAFTDFLPEGMGIDLEGWDFSSPVDPAHRHKIVPGWNLGVVPFYRRLAKLTRAASVPWGLRPFDVNARIGFDPATVAKSEWYHAYRARCAEALGPIQAASRCTGTGRVRFRRYLGEMLLSRIGFSPFGWGEVCFRDYEVVAAGALLVKPSMGHLKTSPDIYEDGVTYVACRWDLADLPEICAHYLAHPEEAERIARAGRERLISYFERGGFVADVGRVLDRAFASGPRRAVAPAFAVA